MFKKPMLYKKIVCLLLCCTFLVFAACTPSTENPGNEPGNNEPNENENPQTNFYDALDLDYLADFRVTLDDADSVGIVKKSSTASAKALKTKINSSDTQEDEPVIAKLVDEDLVEIDFININDPSQDVSQDEIEAKINKLCVVSGYTFIQYVTDVPKSGSYKYKDENNIEKTVILH